MKTSPARSLARSSSFPLHSSSSSRAIPKCRSHLSHRCRRRLLPLSQVRGASERGREAEQVILSPAAAPPGQSSPRSLMLQRRRRRRHCCQSCGLNVHAGIWGGRGKDRSGETLGRYRVRRKAQETKPTLEPVEVICEMATRCYEQSTFLLESCAPVDCFTVPLCLLHRRPGFVLRFYFIASPFPVSVPGGRGRRSEGGRRRGWELRDCPCDFIALINMAANANALQVMTVIAHARRNATQSKAQAEEVREAPRRATSSLPY